ncbi:MAG TPA: IPT/TIG domain-containing protein [Thermoanaerobaculia bacterium]
MLQRFALAALALLVAVPSYAGCDQNPAYSTFIVKDTCSFDTPCLEDQPQTLSLRVDTGCINWWTPCKPFAFTSCDVVEWNFGDGTTQIVQASGSVTHTWKNPGEHQVEVTIRNANGSRTTYSRMIAVQSPPARVTWSKELYTAKESDPNVTLTLLRSGDLSRPVTVMLIAGGEGRATLEYVRDRAITIPAGVTSMPVVLDINDDNVWNGEQRFDAYVNDNSGSAVLPIASSIAATEVRIEENEPGPVLTVRNVTVTEGDGPQIVRIPHTLSQPLDVELMLWWQIGSGSAKIGEDWNTTHGQAYFVDKRIKAGQTGVDLEIVILGDTKTEADEQIVITVDDPVSLGGPPYTPVQLSQPQIVITIVDDDLYSLSTAGSVAAGSAVPLTLKTTQPSPSPITASVVSSDPTVVSVPPAVTLGANASSVTFEVTTLRPGTATVTVQMPFGKSLSTSVTARGAAEIRFTEGLAKVELGGSRLLTLVTNPPAHGSVAIDASPRGYVRMTNKVELDAKGEARFLVEGAQLGMPELFATLPPEYDSQPARIYVDVVQGLNPLLHSVSPKAGNANGGQNVTLTGLDFTRDCQVLFGGIPATAVQWSSERTLIATTPRHTAGVVAVTVNCGGKATVLENGYRFVSSGRRRAV